MDRREFLKQAMAAGLVSGAGLTVAARQVLAMAPDQLLEGVRRVQGTVLINGAPAQVNAMVFPGDTITTGSASHAVFVVGKDAFLIRENARIEILGDERGAGQQQGTSKLIRTVKVAAGRVLSVFGKGEKRIETVTAVAGVRGSAVYVESEPDLTYLCLCYGEADLSAPQHPSAREIVITRHHDQPRYILAKNAGRPFLRAPVINHTDEELVMLEGLVGRKPPFVGAGGGGGSSHY
jgi:hypothetical protein